MGEQFISITDVARLLGVTYVRSYQLIAGGEIDSQMVAGHRLVDRKSAEKYKRQRDAKRAKQASTRAAV